MDYSLSEKPVGPREVVVMVVAVMMASKRVHDVPKFIVYFPMARRN